MSDQGGWPGGAYPARAAGGDSDRILTVVVYVLQLVGCGVIGLIIAYLRRGALAGTPYHSHMTFVIRTFWLAVLGALVGGVLTLLYIGWLVLAAVSLWALVRTIAGLLRAIDGRPIADPDTWLV